MRVRHTETASDPAVADFHRLTDVQWRSAFESEHGLFVAEGRLVIERALAAGLRVRRVLTDERWLAGLTPLLDGVPGAGDLEVVVADEVVLRRITGYRVHRGALAVMERPDPPPVAAVLAGAGRVLLLEDLVDHTNVGAAFRSAAALGFDAIITSPRCADPWYRRSVKVSMGSVFAVPWTRAHDWDGALTDVSAAGFHLLALTPPPATAGTGYVRLADVPEPARRRPALIVGSEGPGVRPQTLARVEWAVGIPMSAGVDSLNAAAAVAVACYSLGPACAPI